MQDTSDGIGRRFVWTMGEIPVRPRASFLMTSTVIAIVCAITGESRAILLRHGIPRPPNTTTTNNLLRILLLLRTILPETHIGAAKATLDQGAGLDTGIANISTTAGHLCETRELTMRLRLQKIPCRILMNSTVVVHDSCVPRRRYHHRRRGRRR